MTKSFALRSSARPRAFSWCTLKFSRRERFARRAIISISLTLVLSPLQENKKQNTCAVLNFLCCCPFLQEQFWDCTTSNRKWKVETLNQSCWVVKSFLCRDTQRMCHTQYFLRNFEIYFWGQHPSQKTCRGSWRNKTKDLILDEFSRGLILKCRRSFRYQEASWSLRRCF